MYPRSDEAAGVRCEARCGAARPDTPPRDGCTVWGSATTCGAGTLCDPVAANCAPEPLAPRIVTPLGGALVSGGLVLQWTTDATATESWVQVCSDAPCTNVVAQVSGPTGATLTTPLPRGPYFIRARGRRLLADQTYLEGVKWTPTRAVFVTGSPVTSPALLGMMPDFDGDGRPEQVIANTFPPTSANAAATIRVAWGKGGSTTLTGGWSVSGVSESTFAAAVQNMGDFDGDGRPELVTISSLKTSSGGTVDPIKLLRYGLNAQGALVQLQSWDVAAPYHSLVPVGDIDGDGFADILFVRRLPLVVLSPGISGESGVEAVILFGGPAGFLRTSSIQYPIPTALRGIGSRVTVRGVGDMDGDGLADVAFGIFANAGNCAPSPTAPPPPYPGYVEVLRGSTSSPLTQVLVHIPELSSLTPLGDINGDGLADVGVVQQARLYKKPVSTGTTTCNGGTTQVLLDGSLIVYYGAATAPLPSSSWTIPAYDVATCDNGWNYGPTFQLTGYAFLAGGGDLDADTFGDVVLSTPRLSDVGATDCPSYPGQVRIFYGSAGGLLSPPAQVIDGPDGNDRQFGRSAVITGNVTGGAGDDLLVGARDWHDASHTVNTTARVRLYTGPRAGLASVATYTSGAPAASNDSFGVRLVGGL